MENAHNPTHRILRARVLLDYLPIALTMLCWFFPLLYADDKMRLLTSFQERKLLLGPFILVLACSVLILIFQQRGKGHLSIIGYVLVVAFFGLFAALRIFLSVNAVPIIVATTLLTGLWTFDTNLRDSNKLPDYIKSSWIKFAEIIISIALIFVLDRWFHPVHRSETNHSFLIFAIPFFAVAFSFYQGVILNDKSNPQTLRYIVLTVSMFCAALALFLEVMVDLRGRKDDHFPQPLSLAVALLACAFPLGISTGKLFFRNQETPKPNATSTPHKASSSKSWVTVLILLSILLIFALTILQSSILDPMYRIDKKSLGLNISSVTCWAVATSLCLVATLLAAPVRTKLTLWVVGLLGPIGTISYQVYPQTTFEIPYAIVFSLILLLPFSLTWLQLHRYAGWKFFDPNSNPTIEYKSMTRLTILCGISTAVCVCLLWLGASQRSSSIMNSVPYLSNMALALCMAFVPWALLLGMSIPKGYSYAVCGSVLILYAMGALLTTFTLPSAKGTTDAIFVILQIAFWPLQAITPPLLIASILKHYGLEFSFGQPVTSMTTGDFEN